MKKFTKVQAVVWMRGYGDGFNGEPYNEGNISVELKAIYSEAFSEGRKEKKAIYAHVRL